MLNQAAVVVRGERAVIGDIGVDPGSAAKRAVVPDALGVVVDGVAVDDGVGAGDGARAIRPGDGAVEPPHLAELLDRGREDLKVLPRVEVIEDELADVAVERLHAPVEQVELLVAHPVGDACRHCPCTVADDGDVVGEDLRTPHDGRAEVLERVQRGIRPDEELLPGLRHGLDRRAPGQL